MSFYWFDIVGAAVILGFAAFSWFKGFLREFFSALAWLGGYLGATAFYPRVSAFYQGYMGRPALSDVLGFISLYAAIYLLVRLVAWIVMEKAGLKNIPANLDKPAGGLMGALKGALVISVLIIPLNYFPSMKKEMMEKSYVARLVSGLSELCYPVLRMDASGTEKMIRKEVGKAVDALPSLPSPAVPQSAVASPPARPSVITAEAKQPVLKKADPVVKHREEGAPNPEGMNDFVKSLPH